MLQTGQLTGVQQAVVVEQMLLDKMLQHHQFILVPEGQQRLLIQLGLQQLLLDLEDLTLVAEVPAEVQFNLVLRVEEVVLEMVAIMKLTVGQLLKKLDQAVVEVDPILLHISESEAQVVQV
jgi:hypothetical protein